MITLMYFFFQSWWRTAMWKPSCQWMKTTNCATSAIWRRWGARRCFDSIPALSRSYNAIFNISLDWDVYNILVWILFYNCNAIKFNALHDASTLLLSIFMKIYKTTFFEEWLFVSISARYFKTSFTSKL